MKPCVMLTFVLLVTGLARCPGQGVDEPKVVQSPTFWIVSQWTRILVQTPVDCGELEVTFPEQIALVGRWPYKQGDTRQRFYLRAKTPIRNGELLFRSAKYRLAHPVRILSWEEVLTGRWEMEVSPGWSWTGKLALPRRFPMAGKDEWKSGLSYLGPETISGLRESLSRNLSGNAKRALAETEDLDGIYHALAESTIPRAVYVNNPSRQSRPDPSNGCPTCGPKVFEGRSAFYPWVLDPKGHPFKIQCPECQRWFPSNDFAAGDMHSGEFPDDGWQYYDARGRPYSFVGYYALQYYRGYNAPERFATYYLACGDQRWGRATALSLFRVAEQYLNLSLNLNQRERYTRDALWRGEFSPQGTPPPSHSTWFAPGFYLDGIWSIGREAMYGEALEKVWDYFQQEDPILIQFLQEHDHPEIRNISDVLHFIETGYFRTVAQGLLDLSLSGNGPAEQSMAMNLARILNTPRSIELVEWAFNNPKNGMRYYLPNMFFKDGAGYESPGYNNAHYNGTTLMADRLMEVVALRPEQYAKARLPLLPEDPKFKSMYDHNINLTLISRTYANVGDDGDLSDTDPLPLNPGASLAKSVWTRAFARWPGEVNYARALWDAEAKTPVKELTDPRLREKVSEMVPREGPYLDLPSQALDGFGHAILRSGKGDDQRALWMRYGTMYGHGHHDGLTIGYAALKRNLLPEQGYFRGENYRTEWDMNWAIHYCGRIVGASADPKDGWGPQGIYGGGLRLFADGGWAQVATADRRFQQEAPAPKLVQPVDYLVQERTIALIDLDPQHSYAVSIFRLGGGTDHYLSFHGPRGVAEASGLELTSQTGGTLAGPDIPYGTKWDSVWSKQNPHLMAFPFFYDVRRARAEGAWNLRWDLERYPQVHVRMHSVSVPGEDVAICKGKPAGGGKPYELQWVMRHTHGAEPLTTQFVEVLEAYEGEPRIDVVRPLALEAGDAGQQRPVALQVVRGDRVDTIIHCQDPDAPITTANGITMRGTFATWSEDGGVVKRVLLVNGSRIAKGEKEFTAPQREWKGEIVSVDYLHRRVTVSPSPGEPEKLMGRYARIASPQGSDTTHRIVRAQPVKQGVDLTLELDPRIGEGPVQEAHDDGITSAVRLPFGVLYYRGKTLGNEDRSGTYKLSGVKDSRAYLNAEAHPGTTKDTLSQQFADKDGDGTARFLVYDYGVGDTVSVPTVISVNDVAGK